MSRGPLEPRKEKIPFFVEKARLNLSTSHIVLQCPFPGGFRTEKYLEGAARVGSDPGALILKGGTQEN